MAQRLAIIPNVREAYKKVCENSKVILAVLWLPVLLIIALRLLPWAVLLDLGHTSHVFAGYLLEILMIIIIAPAFVAIFRLLILGEVPVLRFIGLRRSPDRDPWLRIKFHFKFGKAEALYALLNISLMLLEQGMSEGYRSWRISGLEGSDQMYARFSRFDPVFYYGHIIRTIMLLLGSLLLLWWPYIAVASQHSLQRMRELVICVKGNIIRIAIIVFLLYMPQFIIEQTMGWALYGLDILMEPEEYASPGLYNSLRSYIYAGIEAFMTVVFYICALADVAFAANVWQSGLNKTEAEA